MNQTPIRTNTERSLVPQIITSQRLSKTTYVISAITAALFMALGLSLGICISQNYYALLAGDVATLVGLVIAHRRTQKNQESQPNQQEMLTIVVAPKRVTVESSSPSVKSETRIRHPSQGRREMRKKLHESLQKAKVAIVEALPKVSDVAEQIKRSADKLSQDSNRQNLRKNELMPSLKTIVGNIKEITKKGQAVEKTGKDLEALSRTTIGQKTGKEVEQETEKYLIIVRTIEEEAHTLIRQTSTLITQSVVRAKQIEQEEEIALLKSKTFAKTQELSTIGVNLDSQKNATLKRQIQELVASLNTLIQQLFSTTNDLLTALNPLNQTEASIRADLIEQEALENLRAFTLAKAQNFVNSTANLDAQKNAKLILRLKQFTTSMKALTQKEFQTTNAMRLALAELDPEESALKKELEKIEIEQLRAKTQKKSEDLLLFAKGIDKHLHAVQITQLKTLAAELKTVSRKEFLTLETLQAALTLVSCETRESAIRNELEQFDIGQLKEKILSRAQNLVESGAKLNELLSSDQKTQLRELTAHLKGLIRQDFQTKAALQRALDPLESEEATLRKLLDRLEIEKLRAEINQNAQELMACVSKLDARKQSSLIKQFTKLREKMEGLVINHSLATTEALQKAFAPLKREEQNLRIKFRSVLPLLETVS